MSKLTSWPRRKTFMLLSGFLAALLVFFSVQWIVADDGTVAPTPQPGNDSPYADRLLSDEELSAMEPSVERYIAGHLITQDQLIAGDLSNSTKSANKLEVPAGGNVDYKIVVLNSGDADVSLTMVDALPSELEYVSHEFKPPVNGLKTGGGVVSNTVTWEGTIGGNGSVEIIIVAKVKDGTAPNTKIVNIAQINGGNQSVSPNVEIKVLEPAQSKYVNLPFIIFGLRPDPPDLTLSATRPNSQNEFMISWTGGANATRYEVEMAESPDFASPVVRDAGLAQSLNFKPEPSFRNQFYFRARSYDGGVPGSWSNTVQVVGAYYDDFSDPASGWSIRRTTNIGKVRTWYEIEPANNKDWFILQVEDKWDWGIASPLAPAPELPYAIDFDLKNANIANLISAGSVFAADKTDRPCPDTSSTNGWYRHDNCFNHFYTTNTIFYGPLKMVFERVDRLEWCPNCGGSPMKRLGGHELIDPLTGLSSDGWNTYHIEVRENEIKIFAAKQGQPLRKFLTYTDTRWVHDQFFGVFASTDEYTSSTARYEYYRITPLDN